MWVAYTLLAVSSVVVVLVLVALWAPVDVRVSAAVPGRAGVRVHARWLFGLVDVDREVPPAGARRAPVRPAEREPERRARAKKRGRFERPRRGARIADGLRRVDGLGGAVGRLIGRLFSAVQWRGFFGRLRLGFVDPADTGEACGLIYPVLVFVPRGRAVDIRFDPEWDGAAFELEVRGDVRVVPMDVLAALLRFLFSPPGLRGIKVIAWDSRLRTS